MTKAQEVRNRRLKKKQAEITSQAKTLLDWILSKSNENTEEVKLNSFKLFLPDNSCEIRLIEFKNWTSGLDYLGPGSLLDDDILKYNRLEFFGALKELVEKEENYKATIRNNAFFEGEEGTIFQVTKDFTAQAKKVFDWMLDLIDENTEGRCFKPLEVFLPNNSYEIRTTGAIGWRNTYQLNDDMKDSRLEFFSVLEKVVEQEENYKADIGNNAFFKGEEGIIFQVIVE